MIINGVEVKIGDIWQFDSGHWEPAIWCVNNFVNATTIVGTYLDGPERSSIGMQFVIMTLLERPEDWKLLERGDDFAEWVKEVRMQNIVQSMHEDNADSV